MRYSYEFKLKCVALYRKGLWPETPEGISKARFHKMIRTWVRLEESNGPEALRHNNRNKEWTAEERYDLVAQVLAGKSCTSVAISAGINTGMLYQWVRKYRTFGYNGLVNMKKGRPTKEPEMKKKVNPTPLNEYEISKVDVVAKRNEEISAEIKEIFEHHKRRYGVRRVHQELVNRGYNVNHKRVQRLMHNMGLLGKRPKEKYHSYQGKVGKIADNIINRDFSTTAPLQKWTTDVSQFNFSWGKCYMSPILDMNTNEIISYDLSLHPNLEQIHRMLDKAFNKFPRVDGLIFHSDQGWQYQHESFRSTLKEHGAIQSMSRKGNCYDNCIMETFFGRLKNELYYGYEKQYASFETFAIAVEEYINYYNNERIQAKTKWMPPVKYREASMCA